MIKYPGATLLGNSLAVPPLILFCKIYGIYKFDILFGVAVVFLGAKIAVFFLKDWDEQIVKRIFVLLNTKKIQQVAFVSFQLESAFRTNICCRFSFSALFFSLIWRGLKANTFEQMVSFGLLWIFYFWREIRKSCLLKVFGKSALKKQIIGFISWAEVIASWNKGFARHGAIVSQIYVPKQIFFSLPVQNWTVKLWLQTLLSRNLLVLSYFLGLIFAGFLGY